jgi:hypothetical protein
LQASPALIRAIFMAHASSRKGVLETYDTILSVYEEAFFRGASGQFRDYLGKSSGRLLILGDGHTLWSDMEEYGQPDKVMAVKFAGCFVPVVHYWCHLHPEQWEWLEKIRKIRAGRQIGATPFTKLGKGGIDFPVSFGGNSAAFAALIAVAMGFEEITLAGCPSDEIGHFYDPPGVPNRYSGFESSGHERNWKKCRDEYFFGRVKSLSGNTKQWLSSSPAT